MARLTEAQIEAIVWLTSLSRPASAEQAGAELAQAGQSLSHGACQHRGNKMMKLLADEGGARKVHANEWLITEKGRIAAALAMAKRPGMREAFFDE